jgi:ribose transport system substrate-binding protein
VDLAFLGGLGRRCAAIAAVLALSLAAMACGDDDDGDSGGSGGGGGGASKPVNIAYLSFAVANSYDAPMLAAAEAVASSKDAKITVFDANNDPKKQFTQLQNAASSGQFDAIITQPIFGAGLVAGVEDAIGQGVKVVNMDQILGEDLSTSEPQVEGLSANVTFVPTDIGRKLGDLVVEACASKQLDPCRVGFLYDIKASALDVAIRKAFDEAIAGSPVEIVAEGESFFQPSVALKAVQNMLQAESDLELIVGSDQGIEGAVQALPKKNDMLLVGFGGSAAAKAGVLSGQWFGDVAQLPATEGRLAAEAAIAAVRQDKNSGGHDPVAELPNEGVITKENAEQFDPEWPG